jgi:hypothetical protein
LVIAWCALPAAAQTVYYVHSGIAGSGADQITGGDVTVAVNASDANPGTDPAAPLRTLGPAGLQSKPAPFVAYIAGRFYTPDSRQFAFNKFDASGVEIRQWPGQTQAQIKMSNQVGAGWSDFGGGVFVKVCDSSPDLRGANVTAFCIDYEWAGNIDSVGRHHCFLPMVTSAAAAAAAAGTAQGGTYLDTATGALTLGLPAGQASPNAPSANGVEYIVAARAGVALLSNGGNTPVSTGNVVDGLRVGPCCGAGVAPLGCGIAMMNSRGFVISNNIITDHGVHALSLGNRCIDDTTSNNTAIGMTDGAISYVWDANGDPASNCRSLGDKAYLNSLLGCDGRGLRRCSLMGFYVHGLVHDIEYDNCQTFEYPANNPMDGAAPADFNQEDPGSIVAPSDINDPETYPIRWRRTIPGEWGFNDSTGFFDENTRGYVAFINERFDGRNFGPRAPGTAYINRRSMVQGRWGLFGCEVELNMSGGRDMAAIAIGNGSSVTLVNSSFYDMAPTHTLNKYALVSYAGVGTATATGCLWGFRSNDTGTFMVSFGDSMFGPEAHLFTACELWQVGSATYSENPAFSAAAQWAANVDVVGIAAGANPFADPSGASGLALSDLEKARISRWSPHAVLGVNGAGYFGNYGAYQYPDGGGCDSDVSVTPASASFCAQDSVAFSTVGGGSVQSYQWVWRTGPLSAWFDVEEGANVGPDGHSWFHGAGSHSGVCTITFAPGDFGTSANIDLACVATSACQTAISTPASLLFISMPRQLSIDPPGLAACQSQVVSLSVVTDAYPASLLTYQWQVMDTDAPGGWSALSDGLVIRGGQPVAEAHQTQSSRLGYRPIQPSYGTVRVVVGNPCGSAMSAPVTVRFVTADFNGDGAVGTDEDIEAFFACFAGDCCPTCGSPDFNGDGSVGTDADIDAFFRVLSGGGC